MVKNQLNKRHRYPLVKAVFLISALILCLFQSSAFAKKTPEYQIKAVFLFRFLEFTKWPNSKSGNKTICIIGRNPFDNYLQLLVDVDQNNH